MLAVAVTTWFTALLLTTSLFVGLVLLQGVARWVRAAVGALRPSSGRLAGAAQAAAVEAAQAA